MFMASSAQDRKHAAATQQTLKLNVLSQTGCLTHSQSILGQSMAFPELCFIWAAGTGQKHAKMPTNN